MLLNYCIHLHQNVLLNDFLSFLGSTFSSISLKSISLLNSLGILLELVKIKLKNKWHRCSYLVLYSGVNFESDLYLDGACDE